MEEQLKLLVRLKRTQRSAINGVEKVFDAPEQFRVWVLLEIGENELTIVSTDDAGNSTSVIIHITSEVLENRIFLPLITR